VNIETIKSYLISLGFSVNNNEFNKVNQALNDLSKNVQNTTSGMARDFIKASSTIVGALTGVTTASAGLIDHVAQLDLGYQKFALRMYMTTEQAKQLKIVTEAMGENINDIAWIPELRERYFSLMRQTGQLEGQMGGDMGGTMRGVRDIRFEITRLKVEAQYALQWIAYYLVKYLAGPVGGFKGSLKDLNDWLTQNMPIWTDKIARWLAKVIGGFVDAVNKIYSFRTELEKLWGSLTKGQKTFLEFAGIVAQFFLGGVVGKAMALAEAFALIYKKLEDTGKLEPVIEALRNAWQEFKDIVVKSGLYDYFVNLGKKLEELAEVIFPGLKDILSVIFGQITIALQENGTLTQLYRMFQNIGRAVETLVDGFISLGKQMGIISRDTKFSDFWHSVGQSMTAPLRMIAGMGSAIAAVVEMVGLAMQGRWSDAAKVGKSILPNLIKNFMGGEGNGSTRSWGSNKSFGSDIDSYIKEASQRYGVPENIIRRVIQAESGGNPNAVSSAGAIGLMQLMPDTAAELGVNPYDPRENIMGGTKYLAQMYAREKNWPDSLRAYNGGPGWRTSGAAGTQENQEYAGRVLGMSAELSDASANYNSLSGMGGYQYTGGSSSYSNSMSVGDVNVYVSQPNASASQIGNAVAKGIEESQTKAYARQIRNYGGVLA